MWGKHQLRFRVGTIRSYFWFTSKGHTGTICVAMVPAMAVDPGSAQLVRLTSHGSLTKTAIIVARLGSARLVNSSSQLFRLAS